MAIRTPVDSVYLLIPGSGSKTHRMLIVGTDDRPARALIHALYHAEQGGESAKGTLVVMRGALPPGAGSHVIDRLGEEGFGAKDFISDTEINIVPRSQVEVFAVSAGDRVRNEKLEFNAVVVHDEDIEPQGESQHIEGSKVDDNTWAATLRVGARGGTLQATVTGTASQASDKPSARLRILLNGHLLWSETQENQGQFSITWRLPDMKVPAGVVYELRAGFEGANIQNKAVAIDMRFRV